MSPDAAAIVDIHRFAKLALRFVGDMDFEAFENDELTQHAVLHALTLMGEAVKRLSPEFRDEHQAVNWGDIAGMRDVLIHSYHRVELQEIWIILVDHLPGLVAYIEPLAPTPPG